MKLLKNFRYSYACAVLNNEGRAAMIDINFLAPWKVEGLEFMDFQNRLFYHELRDLFESYIRRDDGKVLLKGSIEEDLYTIIERFTGYKNIKLKLVDWGNFAVDTAYFNPKNILNSQAAEDYFSPTDSTLGKWFAKNRNKAFKGGVDRSTGKVTGAFCDLPVELYINRYLDDTFPEEMVRKYNTDYASLCAGVVVHEFGHIWGGCLMITQAAEDNFVIKAAIEGMRKVTRKEEAVVILKDAAKLLELDPVADKEIIDLIDGKNKEEVTVMYFTKMMTQRNTRRALSLGVPQMTSEVLADAYAIRMGCDRGLMPALAILYSTGRSGIIKTGFYATLIFTVIMQLLTGIPILLLVMGGWSGFLLYFFGMTFIYSLITYFGMSYSGDYNSDYRRYDDAIRQLIARFKEDKNMSSHDKSMAIKELDNYLQIGKTMKPLIDNTVVHRTMGWLFNGSDFKRNEFEHYSQVLVNHEINLLGDKLGKLIA
ncbi:hypothetical protein RISINGSUN_57 [Erwinia phage vB_EamM_RisingSun]|uniref:Virion structural protein n=1 Tax=Erwinia phage vB_EamM_RisingSun TaxID=2026080 RepID=A0A223LIB7_9CAUD|nr:hypothetical protein FDI45_gp057 [Erwinia phage vB_EamM_RisingSun]ASU03613.1 hypothetical protein RISINGSUN_57 [Erwinia phage vB_EamM_RisingSun]